MTASLETADHPEKLRRVAIDPITRVEGHGKVTLLIDEFNQVQQARLHVVEFRGFEIFIQGRPYWEVPVTVQRLCGICPVSHHLAAVKAMDKIAGYHNITPTAEKLRRLMHYGQMLQSHALHFYHLCSPDLLLGFSSESTKRNIVSVVEQYPDLAKQGVLLRKFGQDVIFHTAGKRIHGTGAIPGGVNKALTEAERQSLMTNIPDYILWAQGALTILKQLQNQDRAFHDSFGVVSANQFSLVGRGGSVGAERAGDLDLYHGALRARNPQGAIIFDDVDYQYYPVYIHEDAKSWSYMKFAYLTELGKEAGWYRVGPLSRLQNCERIGTPLAESARLDWLAEHPIKPIHGTLAFHQARLIEMLHSIEMIQLLLCDPDITGTNLMSDKGKRTDEAVGVIEAPRGTLIHHYRVGEDDLVTFCNLIVSTTHNNQAMNEAIREVSRQYINGKAINEGLLNHIEVAIRAYDPCLSCATHALGKMPLELECVDLQGNIIQRFVSRH